MITRSVIILVPLSAALALVGCSSAPNPWPNKPVKVVVSFPPLYSFVASIGGDRIVKEDDKEKTVPGRVAVLSLTTTTGPHHYTYSAGDAIKLRQADVLFTLGFGFDDSYVERAVINSGNETLRKPGRVVKLGEKLRDYARAKDLEKTLIRFGECNHEDHKGQKHVHENDIDAHMWSGIPQAKLMVEFVRDSLKEIDPDGAEDYDRNAAVYREELEALWTTGRKMLEKKTDKNLVTFHASLSYFAQTFDLKIIDSIRRIPGTDPTSAEFKQLVKDCKDQNVRTIAIEPQYPKGGIVQELRKQVEKGLREDWQKQGKNGTEPAVKVIELDPLETAKPEELSAKWYEETMLKNLRVLQKDLP